VRGAGIPLYLREHTDLLRLVLATLEFGLPVGELDELDPEDFATGLGVWPDSNVRNVKSIVRRGRKR